MLWKRPSSTVETYGSSICTSLNLNSCMTAKGFRQKLSEGQRDWLIGMTASAVGRKKPFVL